MAGEIPSDADARRAHLARRNSKRMAAAAQTLQGHAGRIFYIIAGLSMASSIMVYATAWQTDFAFFVGLTSMLVVDGIGVAAAPATHGISLVIGGFLDVCIAGVFVAAGILAARGQAWAAIAGAVFYLLDGLLALGLALVTGQFIAWAMFGFHLFFAFLVAVRWKRASDLLATAEAHANRARRARRTELVED